MTLAVPSVTSRLQVMALYARRLAGPISCSEEGARSASRYVAVLAQFQRHAIDGILFVGCHVCDPNFLSMQKPIMPACKELRLAGVVRILVNSDAHKWFFVHRSVNTR
jgi:hypothetical protein